ncbi:MAG TPA: glycosyltransferase family 1 protein [Cellulomonas sp.]
MRIVLDATALLGARTGIGRYVHHLVAELPAALDRRGLAAQVAVTTWTARGGRLTDLPAGVRQTGPRVPARALRSAWCRADLPPVELLVGRCDVVHGTNFVSPPSRQAREVVTVHDLTYETHRETVSADSLAYRTLVPRALARGAHVVTPSHAVAAEVAAFYGLDPARVTATPLGVDPQWALAGAPDAGWLDARGLPHEYLVFVGSLDPRKNLPRLLAAHLAARAADPALPPLVLAGPAGREQHLRPQPGVHRTGWLSDEDLRTLVAGSAGLLLPSLDEGFGLPALEALACGRPVLAADVPALREVTGAESVLVDPLQVDAIAAGLAALADRPDATADRERRRDHARRWTWAACADRTIDAYLARPPGPEETAPR